MSEKAHFLGHRQRLKERFLRVGAEGLHDYELLEMFLYLTIPRGDTKPIAKALLERFGNFAALTEADEKLVQEVPGVGPAVSHSLKIYQALMQRHLRSSVIKKPILSTMDEIIRYCSICMAYNMREQLRLLFVDKKNRLMRDEVQQIGTVDESAVYPREIVKRALDLGACGIIMVHNHPSGDPTPSFLDYELSKKVHIATAHLKVRLIDHIIIGKGAYYSLATLGIFDESVET